MDAYDHRPVILGGGCVPFRRYRDGSGWRDWLVEAGRLALADAEIAPAEIDSVVVASESDFLSMQVNPAPVALDLLGLTGAAAIGVGAGGATGGAALGAGVAQIISGLARRVLVVGFEQCASGLPGHQVQLVYALSFDAMLEGAAGATSAALYALSADLYRRRHGVTERQMAAVSVKNHGAAIGNPLAHKPMSISVDDVLASPMVSTPYKRLDCSLLSDGAAAIVLAHPRYAPAAKRSRSRIAGSGAGTDHPRIGDRDDPGFFAAKAAAGRRAFEMAGIADPAAEIDVAEIYDAFTGAELQGIEALGLCAAGEAGARAADGAFGEDGALPVNLSGGLIGQGGAPGAVGVAQAIAIDRLVCGRWPKPLKREFRRGLVDAHGGVCAIAAAHVIERIDR